MCFTVFFICTCHAFRSYLDTCRLDLITGPKAALFNVQYSQIQTVPLYLHCTRILLFPVQQVSPSVSRNLSYHNYLLTVRYTALRSKCLQSQAMSLTYLCLLTVIQRPVVSKSRVQYQGSPCEICGGQSDTGPGVFWLPPVIIYSPLLHTDSYLEHDSSQDMVPCLDNFQQSRANLLKSGV